jgi:uridine phosphorylase
MSVPNLPEKLGGKAVLGAAHVNEERRLHGLWPSGSLPSGAILCYDPMLWARVSLLPSRVACDGWLEGAYLLPVADRWVLSMKATGVGAPTAVMTLEELIDAGITRLVNLGTAGALQQDLAIGDIVVCERAIRDEGTSHHYLADAKYAHASPTLTAGLCVALEAAGLSFRKGTSWTTDAPYRETVEELRHYRAEGVATVEMEAAALFAVGEYRGASVSSILTISDKVTEEGWSQAFRTEAIQGFLMRIFDVALQTIASDGNDAALGRSAKA